MTCSVKYADAAVLVHRAGNASTLYRDFRRAEADGGGTYALCHAVRLHTQNAQNRQDVSLPPPFYGLFFQQQTSVEHQRKYYI